MKAALVQMAPRLGDMKNNVDSHLGFLERARQEKADLVLFPELSLTGYSLKDSVSDLALEPERSQIFKELLAAGRGMSVVVGFVEENREEPGLFYNSAAFLSEGKMLHVHRKVFLPTFGMFEEGKFFTPGRCFTAFQAPFGRAGLMICRDFLQPGSCYLLFAGGAEIIIVVSAAPGRGVSGPKAFDTSRMWELQAEAVSYFSTAFVLYCNRTGSEEGLSFAGGSFVCSPRGEFLARASDLDDQFLTVEIDLGLIRQTRKHLTFKRDDRPEIILRCLEKVVQGHED